MAETMTPREFIDLCAERSGAYSAEPPRSLGDLRAAARALTVASRVSGFLLVYSRWRAAHPGEGLEAFATSSTGGSRATVYRRAEEARALFPDRDLDELADLIVDERAAPAPAESGPAATGRRRPAAA